MAIKKIKPVMQHLLGTQLQRLMIHHGIDETELSKQTGIAKANISRLKNDPNANPTLGTLKPLAEYFGITVSQLLGETPLTGLPKSAEPIQHQVPLIEWPEICPFLQGMLTTHLQWVQTDGSLSKKAFALKVCDRTYAPLFPQHATLIVEPQDVYQDGMHVLVTHDNHALPSLREYLIDGDRTLLKSVKTGAPWVAPMSEHERLLGSIIEVRYQLSGDHIVASSTSSSSFPLLEKWI